MALSEKISKKLTERAKSLSKKGKKQEKGGFEKDYAASAILLTGALHEGKEGELHKKAFEHLQSAANKAVVFRNALVGDEIYALSRNFSKLRDIFVSPMEIMNEKPAILTPEEYGKLKKRENAGKVEGLGVPEALIKLHEEYSKALAERKNELERGTNLEMDKIKYERRKKDEAKLLERKETETRNAQQQLSETFREKVKSMFLNMGGRSIPKKDAEDIARYFSTNAHHIVSALKIIQGRNG